MRRAASRCEVMLLMTPGQVLQQEAREPPQSKQPAKNTTRNGVTHQGFGHECLWLLPVAQGVKTEAQRAEDAAAGANGNVAVTDERNQTSVSRVCLGRVPSVRLSNSQAFRARGFKALCS